MAVNLKTTSGNISLTTPKYSGGGSVDLSNYYTKPETDEKISEAVSNIDIPEVDLSDYASVDYVDNAVGKLANFDYVDDKVAEYHSEVLKWTNENFAKVTDIPDVSTYQTEEQVVSLIDNALSEIGVAEESEY